MVNFNLEELKLSMFRFDRLTNLNWLIFIKENYNI